MRFSTRPTGRACARLGCLAILLLVGWAVSAFAAEQEVRRPNILLIMVDDLGKEWVSCYGAEDIETPHVDALAADGMRFENAYCMPQCTPTRLTLLTGQYPYRHGWVNHWDVPRWGGGCHFDASRNPSLGKILQSAGYRTATAGKWQVSDFRVQPNAMALHGFDDWCMWTGFEGNNPPSAERYWDPFVHTRRGSRTYAGRFGPDLYANFLIEFMKRHRDEPMFLYFPMVLTHSPLVATPHELRVEGKLERHKAMVRYADHILGRLIAALEDLGLRRDTIIVWTTDNGTSGGVPGRRSGRMVPGGKSQTVEAGVCIPFIVNCPGRVPEGVVTDALTDFTDLLPTCAELAGASLPKEHVFHGHSIAPLVTGQANDSSRDWIMAMGGKNEARLTEKGVENRFRFRDRVLRDKRFKVYVGTDRQPEKLVDLRIDPAETRNLLGSLDAAASAALKKFMAAVERMPEQDADPLYDPLPPQAWDVEVSARSQEWKQ